MTHDELLDRIAQAGLEPHGNVMPTHLVLALRAVVELHKPFETTPLWEYVKYMACDACESWTTDGAYYLPYPCPTIQVIEKELG
jgi:hypothetical protein